MELAWSPWALPGLLGCALALGLAPVVLGGGKGRLVNRLLWFVLVADAADVLFSYSVVLPMTGDPATVRAGAVTNLVADVWSCAAYLMFVGVALASPLVRPFGGPWARAGIVAAAGALTVAILAAPHAFVGDAYPIEHWYFRGAWDPLPAASAFWAVSLAVFTLGFVAAVDTYRRSTSTLGRRQARAYLVALGTRDLAWGASFGLSVVLYLVFRISGPQEQLVIADANAVAAIAFSFAILLYVPLLAYGFFSTRLLDVDLKLKWTLRRGTVVGAFVAVFFVAAAVAEQYLERFGVVAGGVAAGLLLLALRPLERAADRVADAAMPRVHDTEEYRLVRKRDLYHAAFESALHDGDVTEKERDMLATLAQELGLGPAEARTIERAALASRAAGGAG